ncbi:TetR/AcrR family transcriptional regulator C-terminal domain-containing protein [Aquipuribacter sp. MA13-6]|uniref:TetR/AcrR family transcriptional regulator C-terminal domain-containing protein n=1 Tax=unclassified Aquipuribacter TaxID=2635084 RepID=UPI003EEC474E
MTVADTAGLDRLTMRRLGAELGVEAMALYHHVANKSDLLDALADQVAAEVDDPPLDAPWKEQLRHRAVETHAALLRHPWAAMLWVTQTSGVGPARMGQMDASLATLRAAGFPPSLLDRAFHIIQNHVLGHAVQAVTFAAQTSGLGRDLEHAAADFLTRPGLDTYPELVAHVHWHLEHPSNESSFELGLDLLLDGLERALAVGLLEVAGDPAPPHPIGP